MTDALSEAIKEAAVTAPVDEIHFHTIEFKYDGLVDEHGKPTSIFIVMSDSREDAGDFVKCKLEATAALKPSETIDFQCLPLEIKFPPIDPKITPSMSIAMDNVMEEMTPHFEALKENPAEVSMVYRLFLSSTKMTAPEIVTPLPFEVRSIVMTPTKVSISAFVFAASDVVVPNLLGTTEVLPTVI